MGDITKGNLERFRAILSSDVVALSIDLRIFWVSAIKKMFDIMHRQFLTNLLFLNTRKPF